LSSASRRLRQRVDLDRPSTYQHLDPAGMLQCAIDFPSQVQHAAQIGAAFKLPRTFRNPQHIVLAGMGGSAVAGDLLARLIEHRAPVPFLVCRGYDLPKFVGPTTLFLASSHSGNTEETLSAVRAARRRKARVVCITTGGELRSVAQRQRPDPIPVLSIPQTDPPMMPRAALGYSLIPLVYLLGSLGLYPGAKAHVGETISLLTRLREAAHPCVPTSRNPAKQLATSLFGKIPWIQGTAGLMSAAAYRWRCQFNENSKTLAYSSEYPELNHNEVVGWEDAPGLADHVEVVILRRPGDHPRIKKRVEITRQILKPKTRPHLVEASGRSALAQLLWTVYLGDFTSLYLSFLNQVDPHTIDNINVLKSRLARA